MILNVSGRTDIVAFYTPWFINRYKEGFLDVRNPFYKSNVSRIYFNDVDLILFCTKNPLPIIEFLPEIDKPIVFHVTLTPYKKDIEPGVINKSKVIEGIKKISEIIGKENVIVRYDPIFISEKYSIDYHIRAFDKICTLLEGYVETIVISFLDDYKNVRKNMKDIGAIIITPEMYEEIASFFNDISASHGMHVQTCCEKDLDRFGFMSGECMSREQAYSLTGKIFKKWSSRSCGCAEMADAGEYNTCSHMCKYCYANYDENQVKENIKLHNVNSSLLLGNINGDDIIKRRK